MLACLAAAGARQLHRQAAAAAAGRQPLVAHRRTVMTAAHGGGTPAGSQDNSPEMDEEKQRVRKAVKAALRGLSAEQMAEESAAIASRLLAAPAFHSAPHAVIYVHCAKLREVDTTAVLAEAMVEQKKLYVPRVQDKDANMHFLHLDSLDALQEVPPFGIREPRPTYSDGSERQDVLESDEPLELVVMPGLAFDRQGRRLGRGGGYYDKFIAAARARAEARGEAPPLLVALAYRAQMVGEVPVEPHDARVDAIVTADEVIACSPGAADALCVA